MLEIRRRDFIAAVGDVLASVGQRKSTKSSVWPCGLLKAKSHVAS
jgi:hypothetical protein